MSTAAEYRAKAVEQAKLAVTSQSEEVCEIHVRIAASFLALAAKEMMRQLQTSACVVRPYLFNQAHRLPEFMPL
jgi:hypothetical protein